MRIVINGLAALKPKTGVGHHVAELHAALIANFPDATFDLYPGRTLGDWAKRLSRPKTQPAPTTFPERKSVASGPRGWFKRVGKSIAQIAAAFHFNTLARNREMELYHEPNFVPFASHLPTVVTVHDLSVIKYPQWHPADRVRYHERHFARGLARARHVIVVSEAVRHELISELGFDPGRVTSIPNGIGPQFVPQTAEAITLTRSRYQLPERFLLAVGTIEPRKNLATVMRAFADLPADVRSRCPLVLAGPWGWRSDVEREVFENIGRHAGVRQLGYTPAEDLPALYSAANALVYPSFYEGFGMPPTEMLSCGGRVIASDVPVLREVLGDHAVFVDPNDLTGWRDAMREAATQDVDAFATRQRRMDYASQFSWSRAARETATVYRRALGQSAT